ncbi:patatin-like phospholipase family protein [Parahaliea mediterranea]|uniref:Patatin-like phospholipase family protein n=1 Tax=Parahaliea mediterranea TaxID=651086 RepID=A0A939DE23_9GAMM|nr:patatin-like phospholipase family protein [Parahaliea mediterranea]MBN7796468.1 patatin-like phospholipase family protein [Parahaliea mediterranea]
MTAHTHQHTHSDSGGACCEDPNDESLLSHIALSLSGGGLRATGFHLGVLDMLDRAGLLQNVHILSSVSGGSLTGTSYALCQQEGKGFQDCFDNLYEFLPGLNTMEEILSRVNAGAALFPSGRRDLITAMANVLHEAYFSRFYSSHSFGQFWDQVDSHLSEIMFNATEFKTGTAFRFQKSQFRCLIGNGHVHVTEEHARAMRMADVMAASACIPAGMEPLFFPEDFHWPDDDKPGRPFCTQVADYIEQQTGERSVALMDGGVYDNQGVTSILLAMLRRDRARHRAQACVERDEGADLEPATVEEWQGWLRRFARASSSQSTEVDEDNGVDLSHLRLFVISDTPVRSDTFYPSKPLPSPDSKPGFFANRTLGWYDAFAWVLTILMVLSAGDNLVELWQNWERGGWGTIHDALSFAVPAFVCLSLASLMIWVRLQIVRLNREMASVMPAFKRRPWHYLKKVRLGEAARMVNLRVGSTMALTAKIFMNRIRQLGYSTVYSSTLDEHSLPSRIMTNEIFTLLDTHKLDPGIPAPTDEMRQIVDLAGNTRTALWLNPSVNYRGHGEMDVLVSAGQMTTCYNLLRHLRRRYGDDAGNIPAGSRADQLYRTILALWDRLREDPMCLVEARKASGRLGADGAAAA